MFASSKENFTGKIINTLNVDKVSIRTAQYSVDGFVLGMHRHENSHIAFLLQGGDIEKNNKNSYERKVGEIYFYPAGVEHRTVSRQSYSKNINLEFGMSFFKKYESSESQIDAAVKDNLDAKFLVLKILQEMQINDSCSISSIETLILDLVSSSVVSDKLSKPQWLLSLQELLNDRWNEKLILNELATVIEVHPATISKHFRKYFSCTLGEYLRKLKIDRSIPLIKNSQMSLTQIAFYCGFADQSHFTRTFKQITGFLPRDFRKI